MKDKIEWTVVAVLCFLFSATCFVFELKMLNEGKAAAGLFLLFAVGAGSMFLIGGLRAVNKLIGKKSR